MISYQDLRRTTIYSRGTCGVWEANGRSPLQVVYNLNILRKSCYIIFG
ncbi:MAG: hypothetical protein F6K39_06340 [Okeania sp. SIO3B3]|nr:hypothetical protein [Okeania sp. SIO3B3]